MTYIYDLCYTVYSGKEAQIEKAPLREGRMDMPISKAQQDAVNKYKRANYDRLEMLVPKGKKEIIKAHAESMGESVNGFISRAIDNQIERDKSERE